MGLIILVGVALGVANYSLGIWPSLGQSMLLQVIISVGIGYPQIIICSNETSWWTPGTPPFKRYSILFILFALIGIVATELQLVANHLLFNQPDYQPFQAGGIYPFNAIMSCVIGLMTIKWMSNSEAAPQPTSLPNEVKTPLLKIPLKKGDAISLKPLEEVTYFEAYDNYSFLYDLAGKRSLCNYSLAYLEPRLDDRFLRVHRKYLINKEQVSSITPHLKGRFVITFSDTENSSITSSAGFSDEVKALTKL